MPTLRRYFSAVCESQALIVIRGLCVERPYGFHSLDTVLNSLQDWFQRGYAGSYHADCDLVPGK